ncbi:unnamed protein product [Thlaspi arvense]|uniref:Amino acid transporter transmembrane domain-containing protein n=1 Tax=Thlaspi arvense TaxID=13288 RepID=A0AAU9RG18_THLAR|nr:unnamed protein product [Thlaspi arvense]
MREWWHAGFHLTTAIVGPTILTLPYAFRGLGWGLGFMCLTVMGVVTFYSYYLMSLVLDHCEKDGRRHIRFRELAADVLGKMLKLLALVLGTGVGCGFNGGGWPRTDIIRMGSGWNCPLGVIRRLAN